MANAIHRYKIPVDDAWHTIQLTGHLVHVASRDPGTVEIWALAGGQEMAATFRVFGTGQPLPDEDAHTRAVHVGTALVVGYHLVWHLFELVTLDGGSHPGVLDRTAQAAA
jgi:hypothetical protein